MTPRFDPFRPIGKLAHAGWKLIRHIASTLGSVCATFLGGLSALLCCTPRSPQTPAMKKHPSISRLQEVHDAGNPFANIAPAAYTGAMPVYVMPEGPTRPISDPVPSAPPAALRRRSFDIAGASLPAPYPLSTHSTTHVTTGPKTTLPLTRWHAERAAHGRAFGGAPPLVRQNADHGRTTRLPAGAAHGSILGVPLVRQNANGLRRPRPLIAGADLPYASGVDVRGEAGRPQLHRDDVKVRRVARRRDLL